MIATAVRAKGRPRSRMFAIAGRAARGAERDFTRAFEEAISGLRGGIDLRNLEGAVASGDENTILAEIGTQRLAVQQTGPGDLFRELERLLVQLAALTGQRGMDILAGIAGLDATFNASDPRTIRFAREQSSALVVQVREDVRRAIQVVIATGAERGLTPIQQARAIREAVGLQPNYAQAPLNLRRELEAGQFTRTRRLSATEKAEIGRRLREGTVDEAFIQRMERRYAESLINRRAQNIARTESIRSANEGLRQGWRQAAGEGVLPPEARRHAVVTPDDRLRESHAQIPFMNPQGVGLDEPFETPFGRLMGPPWEPNCRCGEALTFPGRPGML